MVDRSVIPGNESAFELTWGAAGVVEPAQCRLFRATDLNDAVTNFAERVVELDRDDRVWAGWVHLKRMACPALEGAFILGWTKTSDERPTEQGLVVDLAA